MRILLIGLGLLLGLVSYADGGHDHGPSGFVDWFIHIDGLAVALWSCIPLTILILSLIHI